MMTGAIAALQDRLFQTDSEWPIWSSGIWRPSRLISEKSARRVGSSRSPPALRATMGTLRMSSRTCVTAMPVRRNWSCWPTSASEADEVQSILIRDEAEHGRAIAPVAVGLPHVRDAPHDVEGLFGNAVELRGIRSHDPELDGACVDRTE